MRYLFYFLFIIPVLGFCQEFPQINWKDAGVIDPFDKKMVPKINFQEVKKSFSADVTDDVVMQQILSENENGVVVFMPAGEYRFKEQIKLKSRMVLSGEGSDKTHLYFNLEKEQDCILAQGQMTKTTYKLDAGVGKGESTLRCSNTSDIAFGEYLYLIDNDDRHVESWWAKGKTGQFVIAKTVHEGSIDIQGQIRRDFPMEYHPALVKCEFVKWVGVERLSIHNEKETEGQTSNIAFRFAQNCWVGGVNSYDCNYSHVLLEYAAHCEVMGGFFTDAHDHGNGGKAYGVTLQFGTSSCLVMGNDFDDLRHSMIMQAGANGNVLLKNTSNDAYWTDVRLPSDAAGEIVLHGNYPYANLIEDNQCENVVVDNSHGKNGPDNLFFKNHISGGYGLWIHRKSPGQAIVNNTISKDKWPRGRYKVKGKQYELHNTYGDKIKNPAQGQLKESYYY